MADRVAPRLPEVLRRALAQDRLDLHVSMPGRVRSYDIATQTAEIALCLRRVLPGQEDEDEDQTEAYPILPAVPVAYFRTGHFAIHAPMEAGDHVWVVFTDADLSAFWAAGEDATDPGVATRNGLSGCYAIPGAFWSGTPNPDATGRARIGRLGGPRIEWAAPLDAPENYQIHAGGTAGLALSTPTDAQLGAASTDLTTLANAIAAITGGAAPPVTMTATRAANPIASSVLRGA